MTKHIIEIDYGKETVTITCKNMSSIYPNALLRSLEPASYNALIGNTLNMMFLNSVRIEAGDDRR